MDNCRTGISAWGKACTSTDQVPWSIPQLSLSLIHIFHFFSRSRQKLWQKGETSGNTLHVVEIAHDCDDDAVLVRVSADGPACHDGATSCLSLIHI